MNVAVVGGVRGERGCCGGRHVVGMLIMMTSVDSKRFSFVIESFVYLSS